MNYSVYNNSNYPLYVSDLNGAAYLSAVKLGNAYMVSASSSLVLALGTAYLAVNLTNPSLSGKKIYINNIYISTSGITTGGRFEFIQNGTVGTTSALTPRNSNLGSTNTSVCTATSQTNTGITGTIIGGGNITTGIYEGVFGGGLAIQPGNALGISLALTGTVALGININLYIRISYWEEVMV